MSVDFGRLRLCVTPADCIIYFKELLTVSTTLQISQSIYEGVERGSIWPSIAYVWLSFAFCVASTKLFLEQTRSRTLRSAAIKIFGRMMSKAHDSEFVESFGGSNWLIHLMHRLSVHEVRYLVTVISTASSPKVVTPNNWADEVVESFLTGTEDQRPLSKIVVRILPLCSEPVLRDHLQFWIEEHNDYRQLARLRPDLLRQLVIETLFNQRTSEKHKMSNLSITRIKESPAQSRLSLRDYNVCLKVMKRLAEGETPGQALDASLLLDDILAPVFSRLVRKEVCDTERLAELLDLLVLIAHNSSLALPNVFVIDTPKGKWLKTNIYHPGPWLRRPLGEAIIRAWSKHPDVFSPHLIRVVKASQSLENQYRMIDLADCEFVPRILRKRLLSVFASSLSTPVDIASTESIGSVKTVLWPSKLFVWLPRPEGLDLLSSLRGTRVNDFLCGSRGESTSFDSVYVAAAQGDSDAFIHVSKTMERIMKQSASSSDQPARAAKADEALQLAVDHASPELLLRCTQWLQRFLKDTLTVQSLFGQRNRTILNSFESRIIIAGLILSEPGRYDAAEWLSNLKQQINIGNEILRTLSQYLSVLLREPSVKPHHFGAIVDLPWDIVNSRLDLLEGLLRNEFLSSDDAVEHVIEPSLALLLELESSFLELGLDQLEDSDPLDSLHLDYIRLRSRHSTEIIVNHLDAYARSRDSMWVIHRRRRNTAMNDLPLPLPHGLPLDKIVNRNSAREFSEQSVPRLVPPYLLERAKNVVFLSTSAALATYPEENAKISKAVANHHESYRKCLVLYIASFSTRKEKMEAIVAAWHHALGPLTGARLTRGEATRYWGSIFEEVLPDNLKGAKNMVKETLVPPQVPIATTTGQFIWNPLDGASPEEPSRELEEITVIDVLTNFGRSDAYSSYHSRKEFSASRCCTVAREKSDLFDDWVSSSRKGREAQIAASLLSVGQKWAPETTGHPFPNVNDMRYPPLALSDDFLEASPPSIILKKHGLDSMDVPVGAFSQLCSSLLKRLLSLPHGSEEEERLEADTYNLLRKVQLSDCPAACLPAIVEAILKRPQSSSWHRYILNTGLMCELGADVSQSFLEALTGALCLEMRKDRERRGSVKSPSTPGEHLPSVKVTTIKFIAQLLQGARFITPSNSAGLLIQIFANTTHPDVQYAISQSLMSVLQLCHAQRDSAVIDKILNLLSTDVVPIAGRLNERQPLDEKAFRDFSESSEMPEVSTGSMRLAGTLLVSSTSDKSFDMALYVERILQPLQELITATQTSWAKLFLQKYHAEEVLACLPPTPHHDDLDNWWLLNLEFMSKAALESIHQRVMFSVQRPAVVADLKKRAKSVNSFQGSAEQHWLDRYGSSASPKIFEALRREVKQTRVTNGIDLSTLQEIVLVEATAILRASETSVVSWDNFVSALRPRFVIGEEEQLSVWSKQARPVLRRLVEEIESIRTPSWQSNPLRKPGYLPDELELQLFLLDHPLLSRDSRSDADKLVIYRDQLHTLLEKSVLQDPNHPYHKRFQTFKTHCATGLDDAALCYLACGFGDIYRVKTWTLVDHLCVEAASHFISKMSKPHLLSLDEKTQLMDMVKSWKDCSIEEIRSEAFGLERQRSWSSLWSNK